MSEEQGTTSIPPFSGRQTSRVDSPTKKKTGYSRAPSSTSSPITSPDRRHDASAPAGQRKSNAKPQSQPNIDAGHSNYQQGQEGNGPRGKKQPKQSSPTGTRITSTHILFWSGPLSNWHTAADGKLLSGRRALEILLPRLDEAGIDYPSPLALSTKLLERHNFNCGEQFMMACKGWLFERDRQLERELETFSKEEVEELCERVMTPQQQRVLRGTRRKERIQTESPPPPHGNASRIDVAQLKQANNTLIAVLSTNDPKEQKALGRKTTNFSEPTWNPASTHIVIAASIARAEIDNDLRKLYIFAGNTPPPVAELNTAQNDPEKPTETDEIPPKRRRTFVEGSPMDCVWGVGLKWDDPRCDDEQNWKGENRLGKCHDEAARIVRENGVGQGR